MTESLSSLVHEQGFGSAFVLKLHLRLDLRHGLGEIMKKSILLVSLLGFICGCAMIKPVTPLGGDLYTVSAFHKIDALTAANKYCDSLEKKTLVKDIREEAQNSWASVVFKCLSPDNPEFHPPDYEKSTDSITRGTIKGRPGK
jgi:hypothetical protein